MARKREVLPNNFAELLTAGDLPSLLAVFDSCLPEAHTRNGRLTALHFVDCPDELVYWLIASGLDVDTLDSSGHTALWRRAQRGRDITVLVELGADVNHGSPHDTPLHTAVRHPHIVRALLAYGAEIEPHSRRGGTPLRMALQDCQNIDIVRVAQTAQILLDAGAGVPDDAAALVNAIGRRFESTRDVFSAKSLAETDAALTQLYAMFAVPPVPRRRRHDGVSPISVTSTTPSEQFDELWELLVPGSGPARTQQGEAIRLAGKIAREILTNGAVNWDRSHRRMTNTLLNLLCTGNAVARRQDLVALGRSVTTDEGAAHRLCELAVVWVLANPMPVSPRPDRPHRAAESQPDP